MELREEEREREKSDREQSDSICRSIMEAAALSKDAW